MVESSQFKVIDENEREIQASEALLKPIKVSLSDKIVWFFKHPVISFTGHKIFVLAILLTVGFSTAFFTVKIQEGKPKEFQRINAEDYSSTKYYELLRQKHAEYKQLNSAQLMVRWIEMFKDFEYQRDGNSKYKKIDCTGSVEEFLWSWGANINHSTVTQMLRILSNLEKQGLNKKRSTYSEVQIGDLIFIQRKRNEPEHVGIVYNKAEGFLQVMDVNAKVNRMDFFDYQFDDNRVYAVYEVGFAFWSGNVFKDLFKTINLQ